jgi:hypothetical protein
MRAGACGSDPATPRNAELEPPKGTVLPESWIEDNLFDFRQTIKALVVL